MGRLPDNYLGPKARVQMLKKEYPGDESAVTTEIFLSEMGGKVTVVVQATIKTRNAKTGELETVASGHSFTADPWDDKDVEKAETVAVGRALVHAGYPETTDDLDVEEAPVKEEKVVEKKAGLGKAKAAPASKKEEPKEEVEEEEAPEEPVAVKQPEPAKKPSGLGGLGKKKAEPAPAPAPEPEGEDEVEDPFEKAEEEEEAVEEPKKAEPTPSGKMTKEQLLAKYKR